MRLRGPESQRGAGDVFAWSGFARKVDAWRRAGSGTREDGVEVRRPRAFRRRCCAEPRVDRRGSTIRCCLYGGSWPTQSSLLTAVARLGTPVMHHRAYDLFTNRGALSRDPRPLRREVLNGVVASELIGQSGRGVEEGSGMFGAE